MGKKPAAKAAEEAKKQESKKVEKVEKKLEAKPKRKVKAKAEHVCKIKGCKREYRSKGYCVTHYKKWRHGEYGMARYKICGSMDCRKPMALNRHGYCEEHYQNLYIKGIKAPAPQAEAKPEKPAADKAAVA